MKRISHIVIAYVYEGDLVQERKIENLMFVTLVRAVMSF